MGGRDCEGISYDVRVFLLNRTVEGGSSIPTEQCLDLEGANDLGKSCYMLTSLLTSSRMPLVQASFSCFRLLKLSTEDE